jgi:hypothetical protein
MTFNATLTNAKQGNYVIEKGRVEIVQEALSSSEVIVSSSLLQKPEVYMLSPGPFGESSDKGYWGVVMVNPVNATMKIKMVAINVFSSTTSASHHILTPSGCNVVGISPSSGWVNPCVHDGIIMWQNLDNPILLRANSAYTFLAKANPAGITDEESAFMISIVAFTDFGQFSRQGYSSNMYSSSTAMANVYLTDTPTPATAILDSPTNHILGNMTVTGGILGKRIYVALADFDTTSTNRINSGATLIMNIPKGFPNITLPSNATLSSTMGFSYATMKTYFDGTTQIRAVTNEAIGDTIGTAEAKVFYFDLDVPSTGSTKTYSVHTFIEGKVNPPSATPYFPADAFGTFAITVCPDSGCT